MATKRNEDKAAEVEEQPAAGQEATTQADTPQAAGEGPRRGLGAPPPGTQGDPTVKAVDPGEPEAG